MHSNQPVNILLVDDEPANLISLQVVLAGLGENLVCASSGEEALKHLLQADFAAVLLDIRMPTMSGFEVAKMIRDRPRSRRTAILFLTASEDSDQLVEEAYALGAVDFLKKPLNPTVVRAKIGIFVDLYRKTEDLTRLERERHALALEAKDSRIRLILDNIKDYAFVGTDRDGIICEWEGGAQAISGWQARHALGKPVSILFRPEDVTAGQPELERAQAMRLGRVQDQRWYRGRDGRQFYADGAVIALHDKADNLQGFVKIFRDATVERQAAQAVLAGEERLRESEERVRLATRAGGFGVWTWTPALADAMSWENDLPQEIFGQRGSVLPLTKTAFVTDYLEPDDRAAFEQALSQARERDEAFYFQGRYKRPGEDVVRWAELTGRFYAATESKPAQMLGTVAEITERKQAEEQLRRLAADLSAVDLRKTQFLATLAHELRNPLAPLANGLAVLEKSQDNPAVFPKMREIMQRQIKHMVHLIDDLLDVARINGGKIQLKKQPIDVAAVIGHAIDTSKPLIEAAKHQLEVTLPPAAVMVDADAVRLAQVLSNLLNNAAKYTPPGGRIAVDVACLADSVVINIADNGVGIDPDSQHKVFDMFNQVDQHLTRAQGGLGIGLALVRHLVNMHDGAVTVSSAGAGMGSVFSVRLPLLPSLPSGVAAPAPGPEGRAAPRRLRALVVDDNKDSTQTLAALLQQSGHSVETANDGLSALRVARAFLPDVVFLDIGMPIMNGYEAAIALRKIPDLAATTLVALSGWGTDNDVARARHAGFDRHLLKPLQWEALGELLATLTARPVEGVLQKD
ncbi:MAG: response regulator [Pseudomonadota bacterium]